MSKLMRTGRPGIWAPKGFKAIYARIGNNLATPEVLIDLLNLIGYMSTAGQRERVLKQKHTP